MLGEKIKTLREAKSLMQRDVADALDVDITYISRMEHREKPVSRKYLKKLAYLFDFPVEELRTLWLADKLLDISKNEPEALKAMKVAQNELINAKKEKRI